MIRGTGAFYQPSHLCPSSFTLSTSVVGNCVVCTIVVGVDFSTRKQLLSCDSEELGELLALLLHQNLSKLLGRRGEAPNSRLQIGKREAGRMK